jgi:hypothetical protein
MERPGRDEWKAETPHRCSFSSKNSVRGRIPAGFLTDGSLRGGFIPSAFASPAPSRNAIRWLVAGGAPQSQWRVRGRFSRPSLFPTSADVGTRARMWVLINTPGTPGSRAAKPRRFRVAPRPAQWPGLHRCRRGGSIGSRCRGFIGESIISKCRLATRCQMLVEITKNASSER